MKFKTETALPLFTKHLHMFTNLCPLIGSVTFLFFMRAHVLKNVVANKLSITALLVVNILRNMQIISFCF